MPRVLRRPLAGADIADIWDYIAEDSVTRADAWVDRLARCSCRFATRSSPPVPVTNASSREIR